MGRYMNREIHHHNPGDDDKDDRPNGQLVAEAEEEKEDPLPNYYRIMDGVPDLPWKTMWRDDNEDVDIDDETL